MMTPTQIYDMLVTKELRPLLSDLGFRVIATDYSARSFGDAYIDLENERLLVRIVRDRNQLLANIASLHERPKLWSVVTISSAFPALMPEVDAQADRRHALCVLLARHYDTLARMFGDDYPATRRQLYETGVRYYRREILKLEDWYTLPET